MREFRPMPTTPKAMRHFEKKEGRSSEERKNSQTVSLPPKTESGHAPVILQPVTPSLVVG